MPPAKKRAARQRVNLAEIMIALPHIPRLETERLVLRGPAMGDVKPWLDFVNSRRAEFVGGPDLGIAKGWRGFAHVAGMWMLRGYGSFVFASKSDPDPGETIRVYRHPSPEALT